MELNMCERCIMTYLGKCLMIEFVIRSCPGDLFLGICG